MYIFTLYTTSLYRLVRSLVFQQPRLVAAVLHGAISGDLLVSGFGFFLADIATGDHPSPLWVGWSLGLARRAVILALPLLFFSIGFPIPIPIPGCQVFLHFLWFFRSQLVRRQRHVVDTSVS